MNDLHQASLNYKSSLISLATAALGNASDNDLKGGKGIITNLDRAEHDLENGTQDVRLIHFSKKS